LPHSPALRRLQIAFQVALITPLIYVRGYTAPETRAATEQARVLIENAQAIGEAPEDPLILFSLLFSVWVAHAVAFNGDILLTLAKDFLELAERQAATYPIVAGHSIMGYSLLVMGEFPASRGHFDKAIALYDPVAHRPLALRFGHDRGAAALSHRSLAMWMLGYPEAALADANAAIRHARDIEQAASLFFALNSAIVTHFLRREYDTAKALADDLGHLAAEKNAAFWQLTSAIYQGWVCAVSGRPLEAVQLITSGMAQYRAAGGSLLTPASLSQLAAVYIDLGHTDEGLRCIEEAKEVIERTKETWFESDFHRIAGEVTLKSSPRDAPKAEMYFKRALAVARQQQAKSWELRAAMSLARLWRDQGEVQQARELLAPIYGWFTEGFDTRDLKEAKALLDELAA
jgi:predicted ATPase